MTHTMKIQKSSGQQKSQPKVSQSIPAEWYKNYVPPTPTIKPKLGEVHKVPVLQLDSSVNIPVANNTKETINQFTSEPTMMVSRSLMNGRYAESLPIHKIKKNANATANVTAFEKKELKNSSGQKEIDTERKKPSESLKEKVTVGSFTCLQLIGGRTSIPKASTMTHPTFVRATSENITTHKISPHNDNGEESEEEEEEESEDEIETKHKHIHNLVKKNEKKKNEKPNDTVVNDEPFQEQFAMESNDEDEEENSD